MARRSGGTVATIPEPALSLDGAIRILDGYHHWASTRVNRENGERPRSRRYEITITHAGFRVRAERDSFLEAVNAAIFALGVRASKEKPKLRLAK